jgi:hypothetical protein
MLFLIAVCPARALLVRISLGPRPLQCLTFRGSIPHPMQSLCTLHCWPRNTRSRPAQARDKTSHDRVEAPTTKTTGIVVVAAFAASAAGGPAAKIKSTER